MVEKREREKESFVRSLCAKYGLSSRVYRMREASIPCPLLSHGYYQSKWRWTKIQKKKIAAAAEEQAMNEKERWCALVLAHAHTIAIMIIVWTFFFFIHFACFSSYKVRGIQLIWSCWVLWVGRLLLRERERDSDWNVLQMQRDPFSIYPPFTRNSKWANAHAHRTSYRHFSHIKLLSWVPPNAGQLNGQTNAFIAWHALECAPRWLLEWQQNS